ncbi:pyridoxamine 5'-phosphate oxidase family protein [Alicycliphilus denitrificans]|uniref:pyridoxamine 5'-phosphate oxidase family protein n=1 Tax=Alicycliphilus denitrificans TaxID=179636 RepID=UPI0018731BEA
MPALLSPENIALVAGGVSAIVASRDAQLRPSVMRAVGSRIRADGRRITVFLRRSQSQLLLADIAATGHIAVVFSDPPSHRTVQVKATAALQRALRPADEPALPGARRSMAVCTNSFSCCKCERQKSINASTRSQDWDRSRSSSVSTRPRPVSVSAMKARKALWMAAYMFMRGAADSACASAEISWGLNCIVGSLGPAAFQPGTPCAPSGLRSLGTGRRGRC